MTVQNLKMSWRGSAVGEDEAILRLSVGILSGRALGMAAMKPFYIFYCRFDF
jgi:hypothetical protein